MYQIVENYCSAILFTLQVLFFANSVLNKKSLFTKFKLFITIIFLSCIYALIFLTIEGVLKSLILSIINIFLYFMLYKISFWKATFLTLIYMIIVLIPDLLVLFVLINLFGMSKAFCYDVFAGSFLGAFIIFLVFILVIYFLKKLLRKLVDTQIDDDKKIIILFFITFIGILLFFYTIVEKFRFTDDVILYSVCILILLLVLSNLIKQVVDNRKLSDKYDKLLEFMTTYEEEIEKQRILRHEIKNEFLVLKAKLLDFQKNDEIVQYIDEILKDKIIVNQEKYAKFGYLPPGIKGLCYFKVQEAENKGIQVAINVSKKVKEFNMNKLTLSEQRNLARILGVFLDNAKEASFISKDRKMGVEVYLEKDNILKIIVSNTFDNLVDIKKIGKESFTTKGKGRGHGLMLVNYILERNKIFILKTDISSNVYTQNLLVEIKNK